MLLHLDRIFFFFSIIITILYIYIYIYLYIFIKCFLTSDGYKLNKNYWKMERRKKHLEGIHMYTRASRLSTQNCESKTVWTNNYTTISIWSPTHLGAKSPYFIHKSESAKLFTHCFWGLPAMEQFVSKNTEKCRFLVQVRFENLTLTNQK